MEPAAAAAASQAPVGGKPLPGNNLHSPHSQLPVGLLENFIKSFSVWLQLIWESYFDWSPILTNLNKVKNPC